MSSQVEAGVRDRFAGVAANVEDDLVSDVVGKQELLLHQLSFEIHDLHFSNGAGC